MFTTSRYSSLETRGIAKELANKNSERYVARGKKTIDDLAKLARRLGEEKIRIIEEKKDKPAHLAVISVDELGHWSWESERLLNVTE